MATTRRPKPAASPDPTPASALAISPDAAASITLSTEEAAKSGIVFLAPQSPMEEIFLTGQLRRREGESVFPVTLLVDKAPHGDQVYNLQLTDAQIRQLLADADGPHWIAVPAPPSVRHPQGELRFISTYNIAEIQITAWNPPEAEGLF